MKFFLFIIFVQNFFRNYWNKMRGFYNLREPLKVDITWQKINKIKIYIWFRVRMFKIEKYIGTYINYF